MKRRFIATIETAKMIHVRRKILVDLQPAWLYAHIPIACYLGKIMKFVEYKDPTRYQIRAYDSERIRVDDHWYARPLALHAKQLIEHWQPANAQQPTFTDLQTLITQQAVDLILIGQTSAPQWDSAWLRLQAQLNAQGIGLEQMHTDAAIRTFNVLSTEDRSVWLVLLAAAN